MATGTLLSDESAVIIPPRQLRKLAWVKLLADSDPSITAPGHSFVQRLTPVQRLSHVLRVMG